MSLTGTSVVLIHDHTFSGRGGPVFEFAQSMGSGLGPAPFLLSGNSGSVLLRPGVQIVVSVGPISSATGPVTALGVGVLAFYAVLLLGGAQDIWAQKLDVSLTAVLWTFRPPAAVTPSIDESCKNARISYTFARHRA